MKKKPNHVKLLEGNPGKRPLSQTPKPVPLAPVCPKWLPAAAKRIFREIAPELERLGLLTKIDATALGDYCLCLARLREAERDIQKRGLLIPGDRGEVKNPSCQLAREYRAAVQKWAKRFGLDPLSRTGLEVDNLAEEKDDPMESLLSGV